jgi:PAS domain S-box-containing protein
MKELRKMNSPSRRREVNAPKVGPRLREVRAGQGEALKAVSGKASAEPTLPALGVTGELAEPARQSWEFHEQEVYDLAPIGFFTLNRRGNILRLNKAAAKMLGFPAQWLHNRPFLAFVARRDVRRFVTMLTHIRRVSGYQQTIEIELSINGSSVPVQISIKSSINQGQLVYRMAVLDLTEIKSIEHELKDTLGNWHSLVEGAPDLIATVNQKAKISFINRSAWGFPERAMIGTHLTDYVPEKHRTKLQKCIDAAFRSKKNATCEISTMEGVNEHWYSFSFGPVCEASPFTTPSTITVIIRDVTQRKRTEESLRGSREQLREFAARLDEVREEERTRVAREIHDELGQALTILKMDLSWLQGRSGRGDAVIRKKIKCMIGDVDQTIQHVRKIVSELRPSILDEMGLTAALEWQVSQFQDRTGIRSVFECSSGDLKLLPDTAAALFRVVQEALTNVVRHSGARIVRVALGIGGGILRIAITDDGKGISHTEINDRKSFGIVGMRERVHRIGGELHIFSGPGRGTRLEIAAPLK